MDKRGATHGASDQSGESVWTRNFVLLCCANLVLLFSVQLLLPTLPMFLMKIGGAERDVGFVMSTYTIGAMATRAVAGWLSDRYGRKLIMVCALCAMLVVSTVYWVARDVAFFALIRGLHGITFGLAGTAIGALVADSLPLARMAEGMGYFGMTVPLAMAVAPMVGIWLADRFSYGVLFVVVTVGIAITLLSTLTVQSIKPKGRASQTPVLSLSGFIERSAVPASVVMFFVFVVNGSVFYFISLYAAQLHIANVGLFFAADSLCMVISRPLSGRWADRGGSNAVVSLGLFCLLAGMVITSVSRFLPGLLIAGSLVGFGLGFSLPTLQAIAVRHVPPHRRGAATGTYYSALDLGFGVGAMVWGLVAQGIGYRAMYVTTLIPLAVAGVVYYWFVARSHLVQSGSYPPAE